ncbi:MAG: glycosyltransferase [Dorea sp.]|nr:glycosyltransferase [Dorea sp.]
MKNMERSSNEKRILIISHLAINKTNNVGKTLAQLFEKFDSSSLSQLFFNPILPDIDKCKYWYKITDEQVMHSFLGKRAGEEYFYCNIQAETKSLLYRKSIGKTTLKFLMRDVMWSLSRIDWKALYRWIDKVCPELIFLAPGYSVFAYDIALKISKYKNIPIVCFFMDDYYNENKAKLNPLEILRRKWLRKVIKKTVNHSAGVIAVSKEMAADYQKCFHVNVDVLYTPYMYEEISCIDEKVDLQRLEFVYAGSLGLNRWKILYELGKLLQQNNYNALLTIYASADYEKEIQKLLQISSIKYGGFLTEAQLKEKIYCANVVVHIESFDKDKLKRTRYSISTKIPECLASNKIFLAVGPEEQASINYLKENEAALVCTSSHEMERYVQMICEKKVDYKLYRKNAWKLLSENHNPNVIYNYLKELFKRLT